MDINGIEKDQPGRYEVILQWVKNSLCSKGKALGVRKENGFLT